MSVIKKNIIFNTLLSVSQVVFPLVTFPYASRILGPSGIGLVSFVDSFTQYFIIIAALGIPIYGVREVAKVKHDQEALGKLYSELLIMHLFLTAALSLVYISCFMFIGKLRQDETLFWIGTGIFYFTVFPTEWFFQGIEKFKYITMRTILLRILSIGLMFILVRTKNDIAWYYSLTLMTFAANSVINLFYARRFTSISYKSLAFTRHLRPLIYILSCNLAISVYVLLDTVLLGFLADSKYVGYYTTSVRLNRLFLSIIVAAGTVLIPSLSRGFKTNDTLQVEQLIRKSMDYVVFLSVPIGVGLFIMAPEIIQLFAGKAFLPAVLTVRIMSPVTFLIGLNNIFGMQMLTPMGHEKLLLRCVLGGMAVSFMLNICLIPIWKHNGAAVANVVAELMVTVLTAGYALQKVKLNLSFSSIFKAILACLPFLLVDWFFSWYEMTAVIRMILEISICGAAYFLIQFFFFQNVILKEALSLVFKRNGNASI